MDTLTQFPSSLQLYLSMNVKHHCRWNHARQACFGGTRPRSGELCVAWSPLGYGSRRLCLSSCSKKEFAGWSDTNASDWAAPAGGRRGIGGVAAAGLVGVIIFFAGVAFAALSLNKQKNQNPTVTMETLNSEQEALLVAEKEDNDFTEDNKENRNFHENDIAVQEEVLQEDIDDFASSSSKLNSQESTGFPNEIVDTQQSEIIHDSTIHLEDETNNALLDQSRQTTEFRETLSVSPVEKDEENGFEAVQPVQDSTIDKRTENNRSFLSASALPAPLASPASVVLPEMVLVPASVDESQAQTLAALQTLKVIENDVKPSDLCTRRSYARWLVAASGTLSRNVLSKVYPAMYIEDTELAFDDVTPNDPDFPFIQGLAEAGLIASKLSGRSLSSSSDAPQLPVLFAPDSPLCRQDLVSWKMALERRKLAETDEKMLYEVSGFRDIDRIHSDAWPAIAADLSSGDLGIISLAFGFTRLFQPEKPVTNAQAAVALSTGESADVVHEELARIAAESAAEDAVSVHNELVAQVEKDLHESFEKQLVIEKEKTSSVEQKIEKLVVELEELRSQREQTKFDLIKERTAIETEMEIVSKLRKEVEESVEEVACKKASVAYEKERISKLEKEMEAKREEIGRLQQDVEVEKRALAIAREWAEDEARKARDQAKALEGARERWERQGIKVVVEDYLRVDEPSIAVDEPVPEAGDKLKKIADHLSARAGDLGAKLKETMGDLSFKIEERAGDLTAKLKEMAEPTVGKSKEIILMIIEKVEAFVIWMKNFVGSSTEDFIRWFRHTVTAVRGPSAMP